MSKSASPSQHGQRACPGCGTAFTCGLAAGLERCWCFNLPHVIPVADASHEGCLCPACLQKVIDRVLKDQQEAGV